MNKQNRNRLIDTENKPMVARGVGVGEVGEKDEGIKKHKLVVQQSWECRVQHRESSQSYCNNYVWKCWGKHLVRYIII